MWKTDILTLTEVFVNQKRLNVHVQGAIFTLFSTFTHIVLTDKKFREVEMSQ